MKFTRQIIAACSMLVFPMSVFAQSVTVQTILQKFTTSLSAVPGVLLAITLVVLLWWIVQFVFQAGNETAREEGRRHIIWGIVGLTVIVVLWGIVALIRSTFGVTNITRCPGPTVTVSGGSVQGTPCF